MGIMDIFFHDSANNMDKFIQDWGQTADDSVNGQDCYTITGKIFGQKLVLWISKSNYMILQSQITLGAPVSNEDVDSMIDSFDSQTNQEQIAKDKAQAEQQASMMTKLRGTITDTYDDIQPNPTLTSDDFHYPVPRGVRLVVQ
jgi:outer membrane lipoprotein-sorting protein